MSNAALSSPDDSQYGVAGNQEQLEYPSRPMTPVEEAADAGSTYHPEFGDIAHCRAALHRLVASLWKEAADAGDTDDSEFEDAAHCRVALHRPFASPAKEAAKNTVEASLIVREASVVKEAVKNAVGASQIAGAAKEAETTGAARITVEGAKNQSSWTRYLSLRKLLR